MKLLYIANIRLPTEKAHGVQIMKMCEVFASLGHEVELVVPKRRTHIAEDPFDFYGVARTFRITRLPTLDTVSWGKIGFWLQVLTFTFSAVRYARQSDAEIVYSRDPALFFFGRLPSHKTQVWEVHTKPTVRVLEKMRKLHTKIVAISGGLRDVLVRGGISEDRVIVAHDGVDLAEFTASKTKDELRADLSLPQNQTLVAYVGKYKTMGESKGVEDIISAVGQVHAKDPRVGLLVVGLNEDEFSEVQHLVEAAGLRDCAHLVGHVSRSVIPGYLKAADVLVMNYPNTEHYARYMSPLKLFEYMASGVPIVTSDLPSVREILNDKTALFYDSDDQRGLLRALTEVLADQTSAQTKAKLALIEVQGHTWLRRAEHIMQVTHPAQGSVRKTCAIFSETYLPLLGGAEMYTYNFAKQLSQRGYSVTIFTHAGGEIPEEYRLPQVFVEVAPKVSKYQPLRLVSLFFKVLRAVRRSDLVFANYTYALSTLATLAGKCCGKPVEVFAHGLGTIIDPNHPKIYHFYRFVTLKLAHKVITTSEEIAEIVRKYNRRVVVATAVDCAAIDRKVDLARVAQIRAAYSGKKIIVTVRRLVEKNGIQYLIEALPFLRKLRQDFVYLAVGDGRLRDELVQRVEELNLSSHVEFLGALQNDLVFDYLSAADVVVFPSSAEALSLAAIEVMHLGTPLVVSNIGGLRELVGEGEQRGTAVDLFGRTESVYTAPAASSLPPAVYEKFAEALMLALSGSAEIKQKTERAKQFADEHFDWPRVADRIIHFIAVP